MKNKDTVVIDLKYMDMLSSVSFPPYINGASTQSATLDYLKVKISTFK